MQAIFKDIRMFLNTKKQGDWGLGAAINYFTEIGYGVLVPLTDSQDYDLVVDSGSGLYKIQVKTTTFKSKSGNYFISLTVKGGNRSYSTIKPFDNAAVDFVFVLTADNDRYLIPTGTLGSSITLSGKYLQYKV
jgi:hypothetical protein